MVLAMIAKHWALDVLENSLNFKALSLLIASHAADSSRSGVSRGDVVVLNPASSPTLANYLLMGVGSFNAPCKVNSKPFGAPAEWQWSSTTSSVFWMIFGRRDAVRLSASLLVLEPWSLFLSPRALVFGPRSCSLKPATSIFERRHSHFEWLLGGATLFDYLLSQSTIKPFEIKDNILNFNEFSTTSMPNSLVNQC